MSHIFLSYASDDRERVRPLAEALSRRGWSGVVGPDHPTR